MTQNDHPDVENILDQMLRDEVDGITVGDLDDWNSRRTFSVGDRVYLRCAFYNDPRAGDYVWVVQDQTSVELDITDAPMPHEGGNAVVECDVVERVTEERANGEEIPTEKIKLGNPKIVAMQVADQTLEELSERVN